MMVYRIRFLTHGDERFGAEQFEADSDQSAISQALRNHKSPWGRGHEIWQGERLVHVETY